MPRHRGPRALFGAAYAAKGGRPGRRRTRAPKMTLEEKRAKARAYYARNRAHILAMAKARRAARRPAERFVKAPRKTYAKRGGAALSNVFRSGKRKGQHRNPGLLARYL